MFNCLTSVGLGKTCLYVDFHVLSRGLIAGNSRSEFMCHYFLQIAPGFFLELRILQKYTRGIGSYRF